MANLIKKGVIKAKSVLSVFLGKMVDPINKLTFGLGQNNIENDLIKLEKEKKANADKFSSDGNLISKEQYDDSNKEIGKKQQLLLKDSVNPLKNPGIKPIAAVVRRLNSQNLCNPLALGINAAFPKGSPVSNAVKKVQTDLKKIQDIFKNFRLIEGNQTVTGESIPQPIQIGKFTINIEHPDLIPIGATVFIQQTNNNTIFTNMVGVVESYSIPGANISTNISLPPPTGLNSKQSSFQVGNAPSLPNIPPAPPNLTTLSGAQKLSALGTQLEKKQYEIQIQRFDPLDPPPKKTSSGNTVLDGEGNATLETFTSWKVEYESKVTSDIRELSENIEKITNALRNIGFAEMSNALKQVPDSFPGLGKFKKVFLDVGEFVDAKVLPTANRLADGTSTASLALSGGLTSQEVIRRSKILTNFYEKITPILNFDLSLENIFKKQIVDINKTLRGAIPYEMLAEVVKTIKNFVNFVTSVVNFVLGLLTFLNAIIKTVIAIIKVIRVVMAAVEKTAIGLPTMFLTAGIVNILGKVVEHIGQAIDEGEPILVEISEQLDKVIASLQDLRKWLQILSSELARLQQTFETCKNLDGRNNLDLNSSIQGLISSATGIPFPENSVRKKISDNFGYYTPDGDGQDASDQSEYGNTIITTEDGTILVLPGTVWGFDKNGQIIFGGELVSGATGINFDRTRGQDFRNMLRANFNFYTFKKFQGPNNANLVQNLENQSIEAYAVQVEASPLSFLPAESITNLSASQLSALNQAKNEAAGDKFGNFQEVYLGYTIRIQEEKPINDTAVGESNLIRRRGVAFDSEDKLIVASDLTFSDDLNLIINETKYKIKRNIQQGIISVGVANNQDFPDSDAVQLAETIGANPLAISNIKAQANNKNTSNVAGRNNTSPAGSSNNKSKDTSNVAGRNNTSPAGSSQVEMRLGNSPFEEAQGTPSQIISNESSPNKTINPGDLIQQPFSDFISENPSLKKMQDTFKLLQGASSSQLNDIMSSPGVFDLNGEELAEKLKNNIISAIDPNPEHITEISKKSKIWLEGLRESTKIDYDQIVLNMHPQQVAEYMSFEEYYQGIEAEELEKWIKFLLSKDYTQNEIQAGLDEEDLRDEYKIKFNQKGKGGKMLKVVISRKNQRLRDQINK